MGGTHAAPLAVSMGEPAGIGPDLILSLYAERVAHGLPAFVVYGSRALLESRARRLGTAIEVASVSDLDQAAHDFQEVLPVVDLGAVADTPGEPDSAAAPLVIEAIRRAAEDVKSGSARALVTAPIHKGVLYGVDFAYPGHTEYLAALCAENGRVPKPVMMLAHEGYRVVPLTIHVPLAAVPGLITRETIAETVRILARDLSERFGITDPRIAVTGLNPHAGENGAIGTEERDIIAPALAALREEGLDLAGPLPADTLFHPPHWLAYDAVLAMYHDQALIPIKTVAFDSGVNVTLGLPIVRTSPDHGTAFAIAGTGRASTGSMKAAILLAEALS